MRFYIFLAVLSCILLDLVTSCIEPSKVLDEKEVNYIYNTKVIAHRGYWNCNGSVENSISSLKNAQKLGVYGSEFDVWLTLDNIPIIHHERTINGLVIENTLYSKIENILLPNGEKLPTLTDYLAQGKVNSNTKLIMEIKPHSTLAKEDSAVLKVLMMVKLFEMESNIEYISFSLHICKKIISINPNALVFYLGGTLSPENIKELGLTGLDYAFDTMNNNRNWFTESKKLNLKTNVWTVNQDTSMIKMIINGSDFITTDRPVQLMNLINRLNCETQ